MISIANLFLSNLVCEVAYIRTSNDNQGNSNLDHKSRNDFDDFGILTQFICKAPGESTSSQNPTTSSINLLIEELKDEYRELIDHLDRANLHLELLKAAKLKGRTPLKLRITIKPMVIEKERRDFQMAWE